jgi:hypothetical protein
MKIERKYNEIWGLLLDFTNVFPCFPFMVLCDCLERDTGSRMKSPVHHPGTFFTEHHPTSSHDIQSGLNVY